MPLKAGESAAPRNVKLHLRTAAPHNLSRSVLTLGTGAARYASMSSLSFTQHALLGVFLVLAQPALAQNCPRLASQGVSAQSDEQRLAFLAARASHEAKAIGTWKLVSGATFALLVVGQLAIAPLFEPDVRPDYYLGAGYSALGLASTLLPAPAVFEGGAAFADAASSATDENRCALIAEGERLLEQSAAAEALTTRWYLHVVNVAVNLSLGAILGFGYQHWSNAVINTVAGIAISETVLLTKPRGLVKAWQHYKEGAAEPISFQMRITPMREGGLSIGFGARF